MDSKEIAKAVAKSIFYSSIVASIGSVEMSSKFSVMNFSKDQQTLQRAADALKSFIIVGTMWSIGTVLVMYSSHGVMGLWLGVIASTIMMAWIILSYLKAFQVAAKEHGLKEPVVFSPTDWKIATGAAVVFFSGVGYIGGYFNEILPESGKKR